jgi:hypothetical protein
MQIMQQPEVLSSEVLDDYRSFPHLIFQRDVYATPAEGSKQASA